MIVVAGLPLKVAHMTLGEKDRMCGIRKMTDDKCDVPGDREY